MIYHLYLLNRNPPRLFNRLPILNHFFSIRRLAKNRKALEQHIDQLIIGLTDPALDLVEIQDIKLRIDEAIKQAPAYKKYLEEESDQLNQLDFVLTHPSTSKNKKLNRGIYLYRLFRIITSVLLILLGFALIVIPLPGSMEIVTIFYFNDQDGFTLMDLISLIIVFTGIYTLISTERKK
jgi:hypothetical protein